MDLTPRIKPLIPASSPLTSLDLEKLKQLRILAGVEEEDEGQKRKKSEQNSGLLSHKNIGGDGFLLTDCLATEIVQMESGDQVSKPHLSIYSGVPGGWGEVGGSYWKRGNSLAEISLGFGIWGC